jgi:hypothetical protein
LARLAPPLSDRSPVMWLYLATDDSGSWAILRKARAPDLAEGGGLLELELLGTVEDFSEGLAAVHAINAQLSRLGLSRYRRSLPRSGTSD